MGGGGDECPHRSGREIRGQDPRSCSQNGNATTVGASVTTEAGGRGSRRPPSGRPERSELVLDARAAATTITEEAGRSPASWLPSFCFVRSADALDDQRVGGRGLGADLDGAVQRGEGARQPGGAVHVQLE